MHAALEEYGKDLVGSRGDHLEKYVLGMVKDKRIAAVNAIRGKGGGW